MCQVWCSSIAGIYAWLGGQSAMGSCALCYIWNLFCAMVLQRSMLNCRGSICHRYMYIVLYIYIEICHEMCQVWFSSIQGIYARLEQEGQCAIGICVFVLYIERYTITCAKFDVAVFKASMLDCKWSNVPWVYVHCAIYETYVV